MMAMDKQAKQSIVENYRNLFLKYGSGPEAAQWSPEGQRFRFAKLAEIANLSGSRVLDLGCGLGDFYPFLAKKFGNLDYTGIDIVPEAVAHAAKSHPNARFLCQDVLEENIAGSFDYVLISGVFNNAIPDATDFLKRMVTFAFSHCTIGIAFNFTSKHVNFKDSALAYHDPVEVLAYCIENLSRKVTLQHHYERCDVAIFAFL